MKMQIEQVDGIAAVVRYDRELALVANDVTEPLVQDLGGHAPVIRMLKKLLEFAERDFLRGLRKAYADRDLQHELIAAGRARDRSANHDVRVCDGASASRTRQLDGRDHGRTSR